MNSTFTITAIVAKPFLLKDMVEKLARHRNHPGGNIVLKMGSWENAHTASVETYLEGSIAFKETGAMQQMPFATPFYFTCVKHKNAAYQLTWAVSLN